MIPSPMTWFTVPSKRWTASIMRSSTGSRMRPASSGSRSASSSMEPFMSAKRTVTCLRSPSMAARDVLIWSARYRGMYDSGDLKRDPETDSDSTGVPHLWQNLERDESSVAQDGQVSASFRPHTMQKSDLGGVSPRQGGTSCQRLPQSAMTTDPGQRKSI